MGKMIKCRTCETDIASSAKVCPSCEAKNKKIFILNCVLDSSCICSD